MANETNLYIRQFSGINNIQNPKKLKAGELVDAVNVDITNEGTVKSRPSWIKKVNLNKPHSLYSSLKNMYFIEGNYLNTFDGNLNKVTIDEGYQGLKTDFVRFNNQIIISNEQFIKRFKNNKIYNLTPPKNSNHFNINIEQGGNFPKGRYQIALTYIHDDGLEGTTSNPYIVDLSEDNLKIVLSNFDQSGESDFNVTKFRIYISNTNSSEVYFFGEYLIDINEVVIYYNQVNFGRRLEKVNMDSLPNGKFITTYNGLILTAFENKVNISLPLQFYMDYDNYSGYYEFNSNITMLECLEGAGGGIFISDEENVYFLSGDIKALTRQRLDCLPAVPYSSCKSPISNELFFYTQRGQILAQPNGQITNLTDDKFLPDYELSQGASIVMLHDGRRKIINGFMKGNQSQAGFGDWAKIVD